MVARNPSAELMRLLNGYRVSQAIHIVATLGIGDLLKAGLRTCCRQRSISVARRRSAFLHQ